MAQSLLNIITRRINESDGIIPFREYMDLALYHPEKGFYTSHVKIGKDSHFTTYPEDHSPNFGIAYSKIIKDLTKDFPSLNIVEIGGGNGTLALDILDDINTDSDLYSRSSYTIFDISPRLREIQREKLKKHDNVKIFPTEEFDEVESLEGVIITNELPDTFPVDLAFCSNGEIKQLFVAEMNGKLFAEYLEPQLEIEIYLNSHDYINHMKNLGSNPDIFEVISYGIPINRNMVEWYSKACSKIKKGAIITNDYGHFNAEEHSESLANFRMYGNSLAKYNLNPLLSPGKVDMTSDINFAILEKMGIENGCKTAYIGTQQSLVMMSERLSSSFLTLIQQKNI